MQFEEGYYIADIFKVLEFHNRKESERLLSELNVQTFEHMEEGDRKRFVDSLRRAAGYEGDSGGADELDKEALSRLRGKIG